MIKFLDLQAQYLSIKGEIDAAIASVIEGAAFVGGSFVPAFAEKVVLAAESLMSTAPLALTFNVSRVANNACTPLTGAYLDVWHCDAGGVYSDVSGSSQKFLRGYQITDANGVAKFTSIYPGWYRGRAVHIHFMLRLYAGTTKRYEFTSQFFFDDALTDSVYALSPYASRGTRDRRSSSDGIYNSLSATEKTGLTLQTSKTASGYAGVISLGVNVS